MSSVLSLPPVDPDALAAALREHLARPDLRFAEAPRHLATGGEAVIDAFRLAGVEGPLAAPLVLRRLLPLKPAGQLRWEAAVHRGLADQGFPVPRVFCVELDPDRIGAPFLVAERVPGEVVLEEILQPSRLVRQPWRLPRAVATAVFRVPGLLANAQLRLHALDAGRFADTLRKEGLDPDAIRFEARLTDLGERIEAAKLSGLEPGLDWLRGRRPAEQEPVTCHGDLVFTNLCVHEGKLTGVFDWSYVTFAPVAFDVAATLARLASRIPGLPGPVDWLARTAQGRLVRRYRAAYGAVDEDALGYYEAYWILVELTRGGMKLREGARHVDAIEQRWLHPETIGQGAARFAALTGTAVEPLLPEASGR